MGPENKSTKHVKHPDPRTHSTIHLLTHQPTHPRCATAIEQSTAAAAAADALMMIQAKLQSHTGISMYSRLSATDQHYYFEVLRSSIRGLPLLIVHRGDRLYDRRKMCLVVAVCAGAFCGLWNLAPGTYVRGGIVGITAKHEQPPRVQRMPRRFEQTMVSIAQAYHRSGICLRCLLYRALLLCLVPGTCRCCCCCWWRWCWSWCWSWC